MMRAISRDSQCFPSCVACPMLGNVSYDGCFFLSWVVCSRIGVLFSIMGGMSDAG